MALKVIYFRCIDSGCQLRLAGDLGEQTRAWKSSEATHQATSHWLEARTLPIMRGPLSFADGASRLALECPPVDLAGPHFDESTTTTTREHGPEALLTDRQSDSAIANHFLDLYLNHTHGSGD